MTANKNVANPAADPIRPPLLVIALTAAGLAGNYFNFPVFLNIDFIFGSIFALLIVQFRGLRWGIPAAAVIASYSYFLWNHPYAVIIMTAEAAIVGWLSNRRKLGLVLADTLYWLTIGMPLVYLFYHVVMQIPFSNTSMVMTKQAVNGITNALIARMIFTGFALRSRSLLMPYRDTTCSIMISFILFPSLILLAISSRADFAETDHHIRSSLLQNCQNAAQSLEDWVENRKSAIVNLAQIAASISPQQMQSHLEQAKRSDANFLRIGLLDKTATTTAFFPLIDELGQPNIGKNFADRPFIPTLEQTLKPMLSEVITARIGIPKPMVTMLAPVVIDGEYGGYITGALSLDQISNYFNKTTSQNVFLYTLIDKNGNIIMTNRTDLSVMKPFTRGKGTLHPLDEGISQWVPVAPPKTSIMERWKTSFYVAETTIGSLAEWKLILEQPVAPFQKALYDQYSGKLTLLFLILLGGLALAELFSRQSIATLEKLRRITNDLPDRLSTGGEEIVWPKTAILEIHQLIFNFEKMANSLLARFNEIQRINQSLEQRVAERTEKLRESKTRFREVLENSLTAAYKRNLHTNTYEYLSPVFTTMLGYSLDEIERLSPPALLELIYREDAPKVQQTTDEAKVGPPNKAYELEYRFKHKTGAYRWEHDQFSVMRDTLGFPVVIGSIGDITDRKRAEEVARESEARWQFALEGSGDGIWDWNAATDRVYFSAQWKSMLGYADSQIGDTLAEWDSRVHPDDKPAVYAEIEQHFRGETPCYQTEHRLLCKDGSYKWILDRGKVIEWTANRKPLRVIGTHSDISERKRAEAERERLISELKEALANVKTLSGLLPICSNCKKIRDDRGYWKRIEIYIEEHSDAQFSHGICRECTKKLYPDMDIDNG